MTDTMECGVMISTYGDGTGSERFTRLASKAEDVGFDTLAVSDHVVLPVDIPATYPFSPSGEFPFDSTDDVYEVFDVLSFLAGLTDEISLMTNACIVPYRHPVLLTKQALTLEALSGGRFELGVGTGWLETEFEVLDVPFDERGSRTDEFLRLFDRACREGAFAFDGEHHSFQETGFYPTPEHPDDVPIWVGGHSGAAFRRVAEFGNGWTIVWPEPDDVRTARNRLRRAWDDFNRDGQPRIAVMRACHVGDDPPVDTDRLLVGEPASILEDIEAYADAGVTRLVLDFYTRDTSEQVEQVRRFGRDVFPHL